jgi:leader peptidase (prepilin peptidase) / N-methyltransferase
MRREGAMEGIYRTICIIGLLGICTYTDIRKRELSMVIVGIFAGLAIVWCAVFMKAFLWQQVIGCVVGVLLLLLSKLTKGAIGEGDGYLLMVTGLFLGLWDNIRLLMGALWSVAVIAIILLIIRKADRKKELPFVPFLLLSYVGMMIW